MDFHKGDWIPTDGAYRCFRCGNRYEFKKGDRFPACRCGHGAYRAESSEPVVNAEKAAANS